MKTNHGGIGHRSRTACWSVFVAWLLSGSLLMAEDIQIRIHGDAALPTLIYLPGIHGDWTLIASFRKELEGKVRFVEFTYPRTTGWSLKDYAGAVAQKLVGGGMTNGWILAESFSSQVAWELVGTGGDSSGNGESQRQSQADGASFQAGGLILAGGFVEYPRKWQVRFAERTLRAASAKQVSRFLGLYARYARFRHRHAPETMQGVREFIERRTGDDRLAMLHRLRLIRENDPRAIAAAATLPVYHMFGAVDPIVPGFNTRWWLQRHCPGFRASRVLCPADHNILGTAPAKSARVILGWMAAEARWQPAVSSTGSFRQGLHAERSPE